MAWLLTLPLVGRFEPQVRGGGLDQKSGLDKVKQVTSRLLRSHPPHRWEDRN